MPLHTQGRALATFKKHLSIGTSPTLVIGVFKAMSNSYLDVASKLIFLFECVVP